MRYFFIGGLSFVLLSSLIAPVAEARSVKRVPIHLDEITTVDLSGRIHDEFYEGLGNKLTGRIHDEFYEGLGNKLTGRIRDEFYEGLGNKLTGRIHDEFYEGLGNK